mgnify:FL=1
MSRSHHFAAQSFVRDNQIQEVVMEEIDAEDVVESARNGDSVTVRNTRRNRMDMHAPPAKIDDYVVDNDDIYGHHSSDSKLLSIRASHVG